MQNKNQCLENSPKQLKNFKHILLVIVTHYNEIIDAKIRHCGIVMHQLMHVA